MSTIDIEKTSALAKISVPESDKVRLANELNDVLNYFNQLKAANINSNLEPLLNPTEGEFRARADEVKSFEGAPDALLSNAPETVGRLYKTPPIV